MKTSLHCSFHFYFVIIAKAIDMGKKAKKEVEPPAKDVFDALLIESKKTATVVLMLKSDEDEVLAKACEAIYRFADKCDENKTQLLELGAMESLLRLINHEERSVKRFACMAFGVMAGHPEVRRYLRKTDSIAQAVQLLGDEDDVCNEFSSLFLSHMSSEFSSKLAISRVDGIEPLINLLASPDPDVQKNSVQTLCNIMEDFQSRNALRDLGGIPALLDLLKSEYAIIQGLTLDTLAALTQDGESRAIFRENDGLEILIVFLGNKDYDDLHTRGLAVLSNCLEDTESLDEIRNSGGLERLLSFTMDPTTAPNVQAHTARAIARAAKNVENGKIFHEQEVGKVLISMCASESDVVRIAACEAIASLSSNLAAKDAFGKNEGIPPIVALLAVENLAVREAACLAIANLTLNNTNNSTEIVTSGGVEQLLASLQSPREALVVNAAACLINMGYDFVIRHDIIKRGIIASLVGPLKSPSERVQSKIAEAIATYVTGAEGRNEMRSRGGISPLIELLGSNDDNVRKYASWALLACSGDSPSAAAISKLGALELLQEINASEQRRNNYSMMVYESLLDFNLSAKYSLTGRLAPHNVITDGFYDVGQLRPDGKFHSLEDLSKQEINQRRAIILVNCKNPDSVTNPEEQEEKEADAKVNIPPPAILPTPPRSKSSPRKESSKPDDAGDRRVSSKASHTRSRRKKEKEAQQREEAERVRAEKEAEAGFQPPMDHALQGYIDDVIKYIQPLSTMKEQVIALAQFVADKMGGEIERGKLMEFSWELHISQLKVDLQSNIIPIGKIERGIHYHRALLYKVLADRIGIPCSLVRGEYNRAWNEVLVPVSMERGAPKYPPKKYIIDLIHTCGRLISLDMPEAVQYQSI